MNSSSPSEFDTSWSLRQIFGPDVAFVSATSGAGSLQNAVADPLADVDVIYNTGQNYPSGTLARNRLGAFFQRGGGYIATGQSDANFTFLNRAHPALVKGNLVQGSDLAGGGIALWSNVGASGPLTGGYAATDTLYLPSSVTTLLGSRYLALSTNPFSRGDAEREWPLIGQAALWSNLTDG